MSVVTHLLAALSVGLVVILAISYTIKTPHQKKMERENEMLRQVHDQLSSRY